MCQLNSSTSVNWMYEYNVSFIYRRRKNVWKWGTKWIAAKYEKLY